MAMEITLGAGADLFPDNPTQWEDEIWDGLGDNLTGTDGSLSQLP